MGLKDQLRRLKRDVRGDLESFVLLDGSRYYYSATEVHKQLFLHACEARNPAAVLERFKPEHPEQAFMDLSACYGIDALVEDRRLVPFEVEVPQDLSE